MTPKEAERIQKEIWRKITTAEKIKKLRMLFNCMNKIAKSNNHKGCASFREFLKPIWDKDHPLAEELEDVRSIFEKSG